MAKPPNLKCIDGSDAQPDIAWNGIAVLIGVHAQACKPFEAGLQSGFAVAAFWRPGGRNPLGPDENESGAQTVARAAEYEFVDAVRCDRTEHRGRRKWDVELTITDPVEPVRSATIALQPKRP